MVSFYERRDYLRDILQRHGTALPTSQVHEAMCACLGNVDHPFKTTQRDLLKLEADGYIKCQRRGAAKHLLYWSSTGANFNLTLSPTEAMTLSTIFDHADRFGLKTHTKKLSPLRRHALRVMNDYSKRQLDWEKRITTGTRFTVLIPGEYDLTHLTKIQEAIFGNQPLEVTYQPRDVGDIQCVYQLKPLGLSHQDSNTYLSALVQEEEWPLGHTPKPDAPRGKYSSNGPNKLCALMLHRILKVEPGKREIADPEGYDINSIDAQQHLMTIHSPAPVNVSLRLSDNLHNRLSENPLSQDQILVAEAGSWILNCRMLDTQGLRLFLLSNAADIEVLSPIELRNHVQGVLERAVGMYKAGPIEPPSAFT